MNMEFLNYKTAQFYLISQRMLCSVPFQNVWNFNIWENLMTKIYPKGEKKRKLYIRPITRKYIGRVIQKLPSPTSHEKFYNLIQMSKGKITLMLSKVSRAQKEENGTIHFMTQAYLWYQNLPKKAQKQKFTNTVTGQYLPSTISLSSSLRRALLNFMNRDNNMYIKYASLKNLLYSLRVLPSSILDNHCYRAILLS